MAKYINRGAKRLGVMRRQYVKYPSRRATAKNFRLQKKYR